MLARPVDSPRRQIPQKSVLVDQNFDEINRVGKISFGKQLVKVGLGFDAVVSDPE